MKNIFHSCFLLTIPLIFLACSGTDNSPSPSGEQDPRIKAISMSIADEEMKPDNPELDTLLETIAEEPENAKQVLASLEEYSDEKKDDMTQAQRVDLDRKIKMLSQKIQRQKTRSDPVSQPLISVNDAEEMPANIDPETERIIRIQKIYEATPVDEKTNLVRVELDLEDYLVVEEFRDNPNKIQKTKKLIDSYYETFPEREEDLELGEKFLDTLNQAEFALKSEKQEEIKIEQTGETATKSERIVDEKLKISFFLPKNEIRLSEDTATLLLQIRQDIRNEYMVLLKEFTLIDESNNPRKFLFTNNSDNLESFLLNKGEPKNLILKFRIPEDENPKEKITLSFNFENYLYLFTNKLPLR